MHNIGLVGERCRSELTGQNDFKVQLRAKPGIVEEVQKGLRQEMLSHVVIQESEESWALARLWEEGNSLRGEAAM